MTSYLNLMSFTRKRIKLLNVFWNRRNEFLRLAFWVGVNFKRKTRLNSWRLSFHHEALKLCIKDIFWSHKFLTCLRVLFLRISISNSRLPSIVISRIRQSTQTETRITCKWVSLTYEFELNENCHYSFQQTDDSRDSVDSINIVLFALEVRKIKLYDTSAFDASAVEAVNDRWQNEWSDIFINSFEGLDKS